MRRIPLVFLVTALLAFTAVHAGTPQDPEVQDPAGDATYVYLVGTNADWADITSIWLSNSRDGSGHLTGFDVHVGLAGPATTDRASRVNVRWSLGDDCAADLLMTRTAPGSPFGEAGSTLYYACTEDGTTTSVAGVAGLQQVPWMDTVPLPLADTGSEITTTVPLGAFSEGASAGRYHAGSSLGSLGAESVVLDAVRGQQSVDQTGCNIAITFVAQDSCGGSRNFVLGS